MEDEPGGIPAARHLTMSDAEWEQARLRADVIGKLADRDRAGVAAADAVSDGLGISRRQVCVLLERYRQGAGLVTDLASRRPDGGLPMLKVKPLGEYFREQFGRSCRLGPWRTGR